METRGVTVLATATRFGTSVREMLGAAEAETGTHYASGPTTVKRYATVRARDIAGRVQAETNTRRCTAGDSLE